MRAQKRNPVSRAASRASEVFSLPTERSEDNPNALSNQVTFLGRPFGLSPMRAAILAPLAFGEARK